MNAAGRRRAGLIAALAVLAAASTAAQNTDAGSKSAPATRPASAPTSRPAAVDAARRWRETHEHAIVRELSDFVTLPNVARDLPAIRRNAEWLLEALRRRGLLPRLLELPGAPPAVFAAIATPGTTRTLVFYAHYDGQPVDAARWTAGPPWQPRLFTAALHAGGTSIEPPEPGRAFDPEWRLYGRSTSDDKGAIVALLAALDALRDARVSLRANVKLLLDGEEENGSPHLRQLLRKHRDLLGADLWLFCDGPVHQSRKPQLVFGARGITSLAITTYGPIRELHSGHYGNWAPNPAMQLARLLATMKDDAGRVLIAGFADDMAPLSPLEREALAALPPVEPQLMAEFALGATEGGGLRLEELVTLPSLNVHGLECAAVGPARNVVPAEATASIDVRLVKGLDPRVMVDRVIAHVQAQGFFVVETEPDEATRRAHSRVARVRRLGGYAAVRTPMDLPIAQEVFARLVATHGDVLRLPTLGGSLPLSVIEEELRALVLIVPIANHDNNQHSHDENLRLRNLWDGIETMAALLSM